jgi:hypothetical protein
MPVGDGGLHRRMRPNLTTFMTSVASIVALGGCTAVSDLPTGAISIHLQVCGDATAADPDSLTTCCPEGAADRSPCSKATSCWTSCLPIPGGSDARTKLTCDGTTWHAENIGSATVVHACVLPTDGGTH